MSKNYKLKLEGDVRKIGLLVIDSFKKKQIYASTVDVESVKHRIGPKWKEKPVKEKKK